MVKSSCCTPGREAEGIKDFKDKKVRYNMLHYLTIIAQFACT